MDFYEISSKVPNKQKPDEITLYPEYFYYGMDLATKGGDFYAYWDGHLWNQDFLQMCKIIDGNLYEEKKKRLMETPTYTFKTLPISVHSTNQMRNLKLFLKDRPPTTQSFNTKILFADDVVKREDYVTRVLPYSPKEGSTEHFDELFGVLYEKEELNKILWFIGALLSGDMVHIQKFLFLYGGKGTGKGTIIKVIKKLLEGYYSSISLKNLTGASEFATGEVQELPLLIDEDCDISSIVNDTNLLKMTSHEPILVNRKHKDAYLAVFNGLLVAASNERFKVKHIDSGITRRAVVAKPTNKTTDRERYTFLMNQINYEIPHIAHKAITTYKEMGISYFDNYVDLATIEETDHIYSFVNDYRDQLGDKVSLSSAAAMYKEFLEDIGFSTDGYKRKIKKALSRYYDKFHQKTSIDGVQVKNVYSGFKSHLFESETGSIDSEQIGWIEFNGEKSIFDLVYQDAPAQLANSHGTPKIPWDDNQQKLKDIDTTKLHFVMVQPNHIVIDFDLRGPDGNKSLEENLKAANQFPQTYAEVSKSGQGIHLHYIYDGDVSKLSSLYDYNIEIKTFPGKSSVRRKVTNYNREQIATISTGLPLKEEKNMYPSVGEMIWTEQKIRTAIQRNLRREYHVNTKPSIDFIKQILDDASAAKLEYDVSDLRQDITTFAMQSTNQRTACLKIVNSMIFSTLEEEQPTMEKTKVIPNSDLWFFDMEVYSNVMMISAKRWGVDERIRLINPSRFEVEDLLKKALVGFNNLRYDNHILMGAVMGESNEKLYQRSQQIISGSKSGYHSGAYNISYLDVYEMSTKKQSLKKWEIELGIKHQEMEHDWNLPLPEEHWEEVMGYCDNDVDATEAVFNECSGDYSGRLILAELSGLPVNSKTQDHTAEIIFEGDRNARNQFVYTDLSTIFPGYSYSFGKSLYRGENPSEGGYVANKEGVHKNVVLLDVESMHPRSLIELNFFGKYTKNFEDLVEARLAIKHKDYELAGKLFGGRLKPYLNDPSQAKKLSYALKIAINIVYGMTSAKFPNKFNMDANKDNIVAKRGALFMVELKHQLDERGIEWIHFKTDSVKLTNPKEEDIQFVKDFGAKYGYTFAHEATYSRMALVTKADYVAQVGWSEEGEEEVGKWEVVGARFADPFTFKKLFSKEELVEEDFFISKSATAPMYIGGEFVGKVASIYASVSGFDIERVAVKDGEEKRSTVAGTKGFKWRLKEDFRGLKDVDLEYYNGRAKEAITMISKVGHVGTIIDDIPVEYIEEDFLLPF